MTSRKIYHLNFLRKMILIFIREVDKSYERFLRELKMPIIIRIFDEKTGKLLHN